MAFLGILAHSPIVIVYLAVPVSHAGTGLGRRPSISREVS